MASPTAALMPTGSPVAAAMDSTTSSSASAVPKALCAAGLAQSRSRRMPRVSAISALIFACGSRPPAPGLAP